MKPGEYGNGNIDCYTVYHYGEYGNIYIYYQINMNISHTPGSKKVGVEGIERRKMNGIVNVPLFTICDWLV